MRYSAATICALISVAAAGDSDTVCRIETLVPTGRRCFATVDNIPHALEALFHLLPGFSVMRKIEKIIIDFPIWYFI